MSEEKNDIPDSNQELEQGTYEIIRNRLTKQSETLASKLASLNAERKNVFGAIETELVSSERITTENKCTSRDMIAVGDRFIFGYNVHIGLRTTTKLSDVFSVFSYQNHSFTKEAPDFISDPDFLNDFRELYKYYKNTQFAKFVLIGPFLHMVFQIGKTEEDIKTFKWKVDGSTITYIDGRSGHEVVAPPQYQFEWKRTVRSMYRNGLHPHISIDDIVFVETIGGELTIKIEDNTETGHGIYAEHVEQPDQTLDDADVSYARVGNLIFLKIKPYKEENFRYIIYNHKIQKAIRIDAIENSCVLLPDDHGVIFPKGYYLQT
ncbi:MAG: hypothetical protein ACI9N1_001903, partial [Flavobacteriales bacterium]